VRLQTREARSKLPRKKEPYWHELRRGLHIGYYKGSTAGTWWLREYRDGKRPKRRLGLADDGVPADGVKVFSWEQALKAALGEERPTLKLAGTYTVDDALGDYWTFRTAKSPAQSVEIDKSKIAAHVGEKLRARPVAQLTPDELSKWRNGLVGNADDREKQRRSQATADRVRRTLFAALNLAHRNHQEKVPSAQAWRSVPTFRNVDRPRTRFLSVAEATRLLNAAPPDFRRLARGALNTGLRLGELLALRAADVGDGKVYVRHSKGGKARTVPLSGEGIHFFDQVTAGMEGDALVFAHDDGVPWQRMQVTRAMKRACKVGKVKPPATFHDLRRSYGSLLLNAGAEPEVIQELLGHADLRMTRRAYAHLLGSTIAKTVKKKLPSFGLEKTSVTKIRS
jgi:integrase